MKKSIILTILTITSLVMLSGCVSTQSNLIKNDSPMTSKQIEKKMNWRYCEESN